VVGREVGRAVGGGVEVMAVVVVEVGGGLGRKEGVRRRRRLRRRRMNSWSTRSWLPVIV